MSPSVKLRRKPGAAFFILGMVLALSRPAWGQVKIEGAWARATAPGQTVGVVYMSLTSAGDDRLEAIESDDAEMAMLHKTVSKRGMSDMLEMDTLPLSAGLTVHLAPNGLHLMLMGLKHPLQAGQSLQLDLVFAKAGKVTTRVPVQPLSASGPPD